MTAVLEALAGPVAVEKNDNPGEGFKAAKSNFDLLASFHMKRGEWTKAIKHWEAWKPRNGNARIKTRIEGKRTQNMAFCLHKLGRTDEAIGTLETLILEAPLDCHENIPLLLVDICRTEDRLSELEKRFWKAVTGNGKNTGMRTALEYATIIHHAEAGDARGLWKKLEGHPYRVFPLKWSVRKAMGFILSMPRQAKPLAIEKMSGDGYDPVWAAVVIAYLKVPNTLKVLELKISGEKNRMKLRDYFYSAALLGTDEAYTMLEHHAEEGEDIHQRIARRMLKKYPRPAN